MAGKHANFYKQVCLNIIDLRNSKGLSQSKFAELAGISKSYLGKIEAKNVDKKCSLDVLLDIADAFDIDVLDLLRQNDKKTDVKENV